MDEGDMDAIAALTGLECLELGGPYPRSEVHHLSRLLRLTTLHFGFPWDEDLLDRVACRCA